MYMQHKFCYAEIPDHVGGMESFFACEYCGLQEGTKINCITKKEYETKNKRFREIAKRVERYTERKKAYEAQS